MTRIIMVSGKGGVGKTTVAASTALACAKEGKRTLVMSFDLAHSLSDSFGLDVSLFDQREGLPFEVSEHLDVQEIDVSRELERHWSTIYRYLASLFVSTGLSEVVAEEVAILPGMEDIIALLFLNRYIKQERYDVIVVDCPPTSESLRFVNINATLNWYVRSRFNFDRRVGKLARPLLGKTSAKLGIPEDSYFEALQTLMEEVDGIDDILTDPRRTTVRLVCTPEKMVIRETQRAFMYFNLYGVTTEMVVVNRVMPSSAGYFENWAQSQSSYCDQVESYFDPIPVYRIPYYEREVVGMDGLATLSAQLFTADRPAASEFFVKGTPFAFTKEGNLHVLTMDLPFVDKRELDISRSGSELVVTIGSFKRFVPLPSSFAQKTRIAAKKDGAKLRITFAPQ